MREAHILDVLSEANAADPAKELSLSSFVSPGEHVSHNTGYHEWYTPAPYVEAAREVMGGIDLDPASTPKANEVIQATRFFDEDDDGLSQPWSGRVWMNPPYGAGIVEQFTDKLVEHLVRAEVEQAVVLVNNATETAWFARLVTCCAALSFPTGRVPFWKPSGKTSAPLQGQAILYSGSKIAAFREAYSQFGWTAAL